MILIDVWLGVTLVTLFIQTLFVTILDNNETLFNKPYRYNHNVSRYNANADERTPYVSDILDNLIMQYDVEHMDVWAGGGVSELDVEAFKNQYCKEYCVRGLMKEQSDQKRVVEASGREDRLADVNRTFGNVLDGSEKESDCEILY